MLSKKLNFANVNDSYWLRWLIYLYMINEHIRLVEFGSNSFNATCDFHTKAVLQKEKYLWIEMFEMDDIMVKKAQNKQQVEQPFVGHS